MGTRQHKRCLQGSLAQCGILLTSTFWQYPIQSVSFSQDLIINFCSFTACSWSLWLQGCVSSTLMSIIQYSHQLLLILLRSLGRFEVQDKPLLSWVVIMYACSVIKSSFFTCLQSDWNTHSGDKTASLGIFGNFPSLCISAFGMPTF